MLRSKCHLYENIADSMAELRVKSSGTTSAEAIKTTLGRNQRLVLKILRQLSLGENISAMSYYGGSVGQTERCISIGRDCRLYYDVPWWIIDTRHAGAIFRQEHAHRLGHNTLRTFNGVLRSLIQKGIVSPLPAETITQGLCNSPDRVLHYAETEKAQKGNIRFVVMNIPNALCIK